MHPLEALRQAAKTNWRAALCWMERVDPERYARPDASIVTKREANQFVADLVVSIERTVSDSRDRANLYKLLSAAMPVAMRRRWNSQAVRRRLKHAMRDIDNTRDEKVERRGEFAQTVAGYLPGQSIPQLGDYHGAPDPAIIRSDRAHLAALPNSGREEPREDAPTTGSPFDDSPLDEGLVSVDSLNDGLANRELDGLPNLTGANNASPETNIVRPPRRNSHSVASRHIRNRLSTHDLRDGGPANSDE